MRKNSVAGDRARYWLWRPALTGKALVIGYGNPLRGDDGIGPAAASAFANEGTIDHTRAIVCHQLTPELAECMAAADLVVFVDATVNIGPGTVAVREIHGAAQVSSGLAHTSTPAALLVLARELYGRLPDAFLVTVGVSSLALGEGLSDAAAAALPVAIAAIRCLLSKRLAAH
jgi:hydrogenase maturation protease